MLILPLLLVNLVHLLFQPDQKYPSKHSKKVVNPADASNGKLVVKFLKWTLTKGRHLSEHYF